MTKSPPAAAATDRQNKKSEGDKKISDKWGKEITGVGWTSVPNILIHRQKTLGLTPLDINILLHLMTYWWDNGKNPYPAKKTLADSIGVDPRTIQRRIAGMVAAGFIKRVERRNKNNRSDTNEYDLTPLKDLLLPHAKEELQEREKSREGKKRRKTTVTKPR